MQITVEYAAQLKRAAGIARESFDVPDVCTLTDLVKLVAERHAAELRSVLLDETGGPHPSILMFVGDRQIRAATPAALSDGDVVTLLSPISGG